MEELVLADDIIQECRREANQLLLNYIKGEEEVYNGEDLMRLVGELNCTHNHIEAAKVDSDHDLYCIIKHLATAIVLAGECCSKVMKRLYGAFGILTHGKIRPCLACKREEQKETKE